MDLFLLGKNMRSFMMGVSLGFVVLTLEAAGNGISRLVFGRSINSWVGEQLGASGSVDSKGGY
tara:strand:- start:433 stop:621 length:189 start_codon:yes stop_codon:yes gene_type:complete